MDAIWMNINIDILMNPNWMPHHEMWLEYEIQMKCQMMQIKIMLDGMLVVDNVMIWMYIRQMMLDHNLNFSLLEPGVNNVDRHVC